MSIALIVVSDALARDSGGRSVPLRGSTFDIRISVVNVLVSKALACERGDRAIEKQHDCG
jgi:hypothetical protein